MILNTRRFGEISAAWDQIAMQSGYTDGSDPARGPNWYNPTLMPTRDWSYLYKKYMAQGWTPDMAKNIRANAAREGIVLDERGEVLAKFAVALTPGTTDLVALIDSGTFTPAGVKALLDGFNLQMAQQSARIAIEEANKGNAYSASTAAQTVKLINDVMPTVGAQDIAHAAVAAVAAVGGNASAPQTVSTLPVAVTQEIHDKVQAALAPTPVAPTESAPPAKAVPATKSWAPVVLGLGAGALMGGPIGAVVGGVAGLIKRG